MRTPARAVVAGLALLASATLVWIAATSLPPAWPRACSRGTVVVLDNLRPHKDPRVRRLIARRGARVRFLPPYSYDRNPIEAAWGLVKKRLRAVAPRTAHALRHVARAARHVVTAHHCRQWFTHAGYSNSSTIRG